MMDIEEIKEWHKTSGSVPISEMLIRFDWLIAEVERLTNLNKHLAKEADRLEAEVERLRKDKIQLTDEILRLERIIYHQ